MATSHCNISLDKADLARLIAMVVLNIDFKRLVGSSHMYEEWMLGTLVAQYPMTTVDPKDINLLDGYNLSPRASASVEHQVPNGALEVGGSPLDRSAPYAD